jgi:small basic protein (TIGR04137 family)
MGYGELYIRTLPQPETTLIQIPFMSQHPSLKPVSGGLVVKRNVLKRFERVALLKKRGQWKEGDRVQGLRKTKADV